MNYTDALELAAKNAKTEDTPFYVVNEFGSNFKVIRYERVIEVWPDVQNMQSQKFLRTLTDNLYKCGIEHHQANEWLRELPQIAIDAVMTPSNVRGNLEVLITKAAKILWSLDNERKDHNV